MMRAVFTQVEFGQRYSSSYTASVAHGPDKSGLQHLHAVKSFRATPWGTYASTP
jgi:hypothetical protein